MQPFRIHIEQQQLEQLQNKLLATQWPGVMNGHDGQYGISQPYLKDLTAYWASAFDWRKQEERLNAWPQFIADIDGYAIHFLHIRSTAHDALPLIISHGWPGSFIEMLRLIPLLTQSGDIRFHLVIPSLLGFGFSAKPDQPGVNTSFIAGLWVKLMQRLGYRQFIAQGGDFGALVSTRIALQHPDLLLALHLNYIPFNYMPWLAPGEELTEEEKKAQQKTARFFQSAGSYAQVQTHRPLTLSYALHDSPVGLAAWILQIFRDFSDPRAELEQLFHRDELLAHISLYWFTQCISSSMRLYRETLMEPLHFTKDDFVDVPTGIARYPYPDSFPARKFVERGYRVCYWSEPPRGGHFAAMEQPALFAEDIRAFVRTVLK